MVSAKSAKWCKDSKLKAPGNRFYPTPGPGYHEQVGDSGIATHNISQYNSIKSYGFGNTARES